MISFPMKKIIYSLIVFPVNFFAAQLNVNVDATAAVLINAETGAVLFDKNANQQMYPASLTKVATALYVLENVGSNLDHPVTIKDDHLKIVSPQQRMQFPELHPSYRLEYGAILLGFSSGDKVPMRSLLYAMMLSSGNDVANALANHICPTIPEFMQELNEYLKNLKIVNTNFNNPHGLHHDEHTTTALDLAKITAVALKNPIFREIVISKKYPRPNIQGAQEQYFIQSNKLLKPGRFYYPKAIGVKTGRTSKAGFNLIAAAEDQGRTLIAVVLNCKDSESRYRDAINLFETAFKESKVNRVLLAKRQDIFKRELSKAAAPLEAVLEEDIALSYFPSEEPEVKATLVWKELKLPIKSKDVVGEMQIIASDGSLLTKSSVFALKDIEMNTWAKFSEWAHQQKQILLAHKLHIILSITFIILLLALFLKKEDKTQAS